MDSEPQGAEVYINGKLEGQTPVTLDLPMGNHKVKLVKPKYVELRSSISLTQSDPEQILMQELELVYGTLQVTGSVPEVDLYVNGEFKGKTPVSLRLPLDRYKLDFKKYGYADQSRLVILSSGRFKQKVKADMIRLPGALVIKGKPAGVEVSIKR